MDNHTRASDQVGDVIAMSQKMYNIVNAKVPRQGLKLLSHRTVPRNLNDTAHTSIL
jgi:hypothetical protein